MGSPGVTPWWYGVLYDTCSLITLVHMPEHDASLAAHFPLPQAIEDLLSSDNLRAATAAAIRPGVTRAGA